jgi:uncharacterized protein involved in cysteine biosynthesis
VWFFISSINDSVNDLNKDCPSSLVKLVPPDVTDALEWFDELSMLLVVFFVLATVDLLIGSNGRVSFDYFSCLGFCFGSVGKCDGV